MKWLKHMSNLRNDEDIARFLDVTGLEGFGFYCMVREMIAESMEPGDQRCELSLSLRRWSTALGIHRNKVLSYAGTLGSTGLATVTREGSELRVQMPKLAKLRDEYSEKSRHARESVGRDSPQSRSETEKEKDQIRKEGGMGGGEFVFTNGVTGNTPIRATTGLGHISETVQKLRDRSNAS